LGCRSFFEAPTIHLQCIVRCTATPTIITILVKVCRSLHVDLLMPKSAEPKAAFLPPWYPPDPMIRKAIPVVPESRNAAAITLSRR
jgi:hypothetical protein